MSDNDQALQNLVLVHTDISLWSAHRKLTVDELIEASGQDGAEVHKALKHAPENLINLGSKRIFPQEHLRDFTSLKYKTERLLRTHGFRSYRAFVLPKAEYESVTAQLEQYRSEFNAHKEQLRDSYQDNLHQWADQFPEWRDTILKVAPSAEQVYQQLNYHYHAFRIAPVELAEDEESDTQSHSADAASGMVSKLSDELMREIQDEANSFWDECLKGRDRVNRVSIRRLEEIADKLDGFRFIDPVIGPTVDKLRSVIASLPPKGRIEGEHVDRITGVVLTIADGKRALDYGRTAAALDQQVDAFESDTTTPDDAPAGSAEAEPVGTPFAELGEQGEPAQPEQSDEQNGPAQPAQPEETGEEAEPHTSDDEEPAWLF